MIVLEQTKNKWKSHYTTIYIYFLRYYCPPGQNSSTPEDYPCLVGHYCKENSAYPVTCQNGTYQNSTTQESCITCPEGYYCNAGDGSTTIPKLCPKGHYCPQGTAYDRSKPCPIGTYLDTLGNAAEEQCKNCLSQMFCDQNGLEFPRGFCEPDYYCSNGSSSPTPKNIGNATGWIFEFYNDICPRGHYCPNATNIPVPCPKGRYSNESGLRNESQCQKCPPGRYCATSGAKEVKDPPKCDPGYVCLGGASEATPTDGKTGYRCPAGYRCPEG